MQCIRAKTLRFIILELLPFVILDFICPEHKSNIFQAIDLKLHRWRDLIVEKCSAQKLNSLMHNFRVTDLCYFFSCPEHKLNLLIRNFTYGQMYSRFIILGFPLLFFLRLGHKSNTIQASS